MKREERTELTKKKIIEAAIQEFGKYGYRGASLSNICKAGIPKGLLYHNYENRDSVYMACAEKCYQDLMNEFHQIEESDNLALYMEVRLKFMEKHPMEANIIMDSLFQKSESIVEELEKVKADFNTFNINYFKRFMSNVTLKKRIDEQDAFQYFMAVQSMFNMYFATEAFNDFSVSEKTNQHEKMLSKFLQILLYGIVEEKGETI